MTQRAAHNEPLPPMGLPASLRGWSWLAAREGGVGVGKALLDGAPVVVRIAPLERSGERQAELAVLATVDHPRLARLVDHGVLARPSAGPGSQHDRTYLVRSWVVGEDLATWAHGATVRGDRDRRAAGAVLARLCAALEHLHGRGFVHGDLKAGNVIVRPGGEPVLTDFGLAGSTGARTEVRGTLFHIAPEVLLGEALTPAADLFALGAMLHGLLLDRRTTAAEFYGRFPREDYFAATGTRPEELPEWARDVVSALVAREPDQRPESAARAGRALAARLGLKDLFEPRKATVRWPALGGREDWRARWLEGLARRVEATEEGTLPAAPQWVRLPPGETAAAVADHLALHAALMGAPVQRLNVQAELAACDTSAAVDRWAAECVAAHPDAVLFAALEGDDAWQRRALGVLGQHVVHAASKKSRAGARTVLVGLGVGASPQLEGGDSAWELHELPPARLADVEHALASALEPGKPPSSRLSAFARVVHGSSDGSDAGLGRALNAAAEQGWFLDGDDHPRLRGGELPERLFDAAISDRPLATSAAARELWAALWVHGGAAPLGRLGEDLGRSADELANDVDELSRAGWTALRQGRLEARRAASGAWAAGVDEARWRALHAARARALSRPESSHGARLLPHRFESGEVDAAQLLERVRTLREEGLPEWALDVTEAVLGFARARGLLAGRLAGDDDAAGSPWLAELAVERAFTWCALGRGQDALDSVAGLRDRADAKESAGSARSRAWIERVEGHVAALRHEHAQATAHFRRARELDPEDGGEALLAEAQLSFAVRRDDDVEALAEEALSRGGGARALSPRVRNNLRTLVAMARFRRGEVEAARSELERQLDEARRSGHALREASLAINLATLERRAGAQREAQCHFERAIELYDAAGNLPGLAQARAQLGSALRETGRLRDAEPLLESSLSIRERSGDRIGEIVVRGMLGLLFADRGRPRLACAELERGAQALRATGRSFDATLLETRALEMRARLGRFGPATRAPEGERSAEGDPRHLLALARAAWLAGRVDDARAALERARALAASLNLVAAREDAEFLSDALEGRFERPAPSLRADAQADSLSAQDRALCGILARAPLDAELATELATALERAGRDDRAARAWITLAVRASDEHAAVSAAQHAERVLQGCLAGASDGERKAIEASLLGFPDPWPEDLVAWRQRALEPDEQEKEVIELLDINRRLLAQEDLRSLLGAIVEHALAVSGAQRGFLVLEENGEIVIDTALDSRRGGIAESEVELSGSAMRQAFHDMRPMRVSNAIDDPLLGGAPSVVALDLRSILCVPFRVDKGLRGMVYVDHRLREGAFDARAERMLCLLADQAALAILQVRRLEEIRRLNRELSKHVVAVESDLRTARRALSGAGLPATAGGLVGTSQPMQDVRRLLELAAQSKLAVLVSGESGTGKELAARALHELSPRTSGPFVSENCAALPPSLIESELFGARKGAYTGADRDREGLFERAHGGTLFLDEVGELPLDLQAKLLRTLETGEVRRLGDEVARRVDFRLVVATNRNLTQEVEAGRFRADLYYRLKGLNVHMPPLSKRVEDIPELVDHFLRLQQRQDDVAREVDKTVLARLVRRAWPGNVRELFNELARLCVLSSGDLLDADLVSESAALGRGPARGSSDVKTLAELEREAIEHALEVTGGDKTEAARRLGISRAKVYQRLKEWGEDGTEGQPPPA